MPIRYPAALRSGDVIGVTAPSSGVPADLIPRLEVALQVLRDRGYDVVVGGCMDGSGVVSAPASARAAELTEMLVDPRIRAVIPPWGGELAVEVLPLLDLDAIAQAEPTWVVGYSDIATLLLPLTTTTGVATLHAQNLMDTPFQVPPPLRPWLDVAALGPGATFEQGPSARHQVHGAYTFRDNPDVTEHTLDTEGTWRLLHPDRDPQTVQGRLIGGCLETVSILAGTEYGDLVAFDSAHAPEGLIVYVEASGHEAVDVARDLWRLRLCGWFDVANAVLVGRTTAPGSSGLTQAEAVASVLGDLEVPVVLDVDFGHVPPQMALVNGALATLTVGDAFSLTQVLL